MRLGRQLLPLEAVDANHRIGAAELRQLTRQFRRIVRERLDLFLLQRQPELRRAAVSGCLLRVASDRHAVCQLGERQHDDVLVVAGPDTDIAELADLEPGKLGADAVAAGRHRVDDGDALVGRLDRRQRYRLRRRLEPDDGDRGVWHDGATLVDDGHLDFPLARGLRDERDGK